jgi:hypothetical protein
VPVPLRVHGARLLKKIHQLKRMYWMRGSGCRGGHGTTLHNITKGTINVVYQIIPLMHH